MGKKISTETKITSTSDLTLGDIVEAVTGEGRKEIEKIVKSVVRPCAIGNIPTFNAPEAGRDGSAGDGNTARFSNGRLVGGSAGIRVAGAVNTCAGAGAGANAEFVTFADGTTGQPARRAARASKLPHDATDSKWFNAVLQNGEVWTPYTCRRFLPAQYLRLMQSASSIDAAIARSYDMRNMFRLLEDELGNLVFMETHWRSAYAERSKFLPMDTVREIFRQYLDGLYENINDRAKCTFNKKRGEYWRRIRGVGDVTLWTEKTTSSDGDFGAFSKTTSVKPSDWLLETNAKIEVARSKLKKCYDYNDALDLLRKHMPQISMGVFKDSEGMYRNWLPKAWKEAFKRQGAYYTLKSLVMNRHVQYTTELGSWRRKVTTMADTPRDGLNSLKKLLASEAPAYVIHAILKKSIEASRFDVAKFLRGGCR